MIRVAHADDHRVVRLGLEQLLETFADVKPVGSATGGEAAIALCREQQHGRHRPLSGPRRQRDDRETCGGAASI